MKYPINRLRRLRYNKILRNMIEDVSINAADLICPVFITEGQNIKEPIESMPGQFRYSIDPFSVNDARKFCGIYYTLDNQKLFLLKMNHLFPH